MILTTLFLLFFVNESYIGFEGNLTLKYIIFGLALPLCFLTYLTISAKKPADYHQASVLTKFIMFIGLLYSPVFYFLLAKETGIRLFNLFSIQ